MRVISVRFFLPFVILLFDFPVYFYDPFEYYSNSESKAPLSHLVNTNNLRTLLSLRVLLYRPHPTPRLSASNSPPSNAVPIGRVGDLRTGKIYAQALCTG